jgi:glycosyltransferase involved in cell wall biosynthesis
MRTSTAQTGEPQAIVFCITELDPGGAERALVQLVTGLDRQRWQPTVICLAERGELADVLEQAGIPVIALGARGRWQVSVLFRLIRELRRIRPVLLQTYLFHANILGRLAARWVRVPVVVSGIRVAERRSRWYLWLDRLTQSLVQRHVCVSQGVREFSQAEAGLSPEKLVVIGNGVEFERFTQAIPAERAEFGLTVDDMVLLTVGRLDPQKGMLELLAAVRLLRTDFPQLKLLVAGEGPLRAELERVMQTEHLQSVVHLLGRRADVPGLYRMADLFVLASRWEGQPNVVLEAMAAGLPIVSTQVEGIDELLNEEESALLVPTGDVAALAGAIKRLIENPVLRKKLAVKAQQKVQADHSWEQTVAQYERLYAELIDEESNP